MLPEKNLLQSLRSSPLEMSRPLPACSAAVDPILIARDERGELPLRHPEPCTLLRNVAGRVESFQSIANDESITVALQHNVCRPSLDYTKMDVERRSSGKQRG